LRRVTRTAWTLAPELKDAWDNDGWCVIEGAIPESDLAPAQQALTRLFPTAEQMDTGLDDEQTRRWRDWDAAWPEFPFHSRSLNALVVHDVMLDLAEELLGTDDIRLYLALVTAKYANQASGYNQLLHTDYPNHTVVVPRRDAGYQHLETFLYLNDVSAETGATRIVSRRKTAHIPVERHTLGYAEYADLYDDPADASGPAGSIVAYRPDVYHRSVDVSRPGSSRFMLHLAYRPATTPWVGYHAWPIKGFSLEWSRFVQGATPRQLATVGFPKPGDPYWTDETVLGVGARYPGLDMTPWREAQRGR